jgi:hypothetical protein
MMQGAPGMPAPRGHDAQRGGVHTAHVRDEWHGAALVHIRLQPGRRVAWHGMASLRPLHNNSVNSDSNKNNNNNKILIILTLILIIIMIIIIIIIITTIIIIIIIIIMMMMIIITIIIIAIIIVATITCR